MTNFFYVPMPHGKNDLGCKQAKGNPFEHWFVSSEVSSVAISHCNAVRYKSDFVDLQNNPHCPYCKMIEELRDGLDEITERMVRLDQIPVQVKSKLTKPNLKSKPKKGR